MAVSSEEIFFELKTLLIKYKSELEIRTDSSSGFELYSHKTVKTSKTGKNEVFFAGAMIHKGFVGFYFMPIYTHPEQFSGLPERLKKLLKGKSCFRVKQLDSEIKSELGNLLDEGFNFYKTLGWI
jgi:hypothetical protein